jgi:hypothetical protein
MNPAQVLLFHIYNRQIKKKHTLVSNWEIGEHKCGSENYFYAAIYLRLRFKISKTSGGQRPAQRTARPESSTTPVQEPPV